jgi:hypothetical protein
MAVGIQQAQVANQINFAVARKVLDAQNEQGAGVLQLLSAATGGSKAGDALTAAATGLGGQLDVTA